VPKCLCAPGGGVVKASLKSFNQPHFLFYEKVFAGHF
jgi:hypothetical protein